MDRHMLWLFMDNYKRELFLKNELKRRLLKAIKCNKNITYLQRYYASQKLSLFPRFSGRTATVNRCSISSRAFSVKKVSGYSRFVFRREVSHANIPGCRRASW